MAKFQREYLSCPGEVFLMRDKGTPAGKSRKPESAEGKTGSAPEGKAAQAKPVEMTSKEKIAANQKNKRRK
jgi:hypothetical protein